MVTFTERSKPQVDDAFVGKVNITVASVHTTTIVIKNVTFEEEACYVCTFSVYPSGTERETACLTVQGLSGITLQLPNKPKEKNTVVSCSATGKPRPVITWRSGEEQLSNDLSESSTVQNEDSTATTTSNLTIPQSQYSGKYVTCVAKSGSIERTKNIILENPIEKEPPVASRYYTVTAVVVCFGVFAASCILILFHRKRRKEKKHLVDVA
ncbi:OX-2 membrane glycoprotein-like isoform X2 [Neoarius graeffei]|nr:OX-2 membrane glycoprotein-like isoform X2 [Neoarius graeffei]